MESFVYGGLAVRFVRQGRGEPVVLVHNGGTSHAIWQGVLPALADRYEVFALDLPGFGASPGREGGYALADYVDVLGAFVDACCAGPVRLVGNCMGSAMALELARRRRDVAALVLINPLTAATLAGGRLGVAPWLRDRAPGLSRALYRALGRVVLPAAVARQALAFQLGGAGRAGGVALNPALLACFARQDQARSLLGVLDDVASYAVLDHFRPGADFPPLCTVWGLENRVLSASAGRRLNEQLRPVRAEWLADCGHLAMLERPALVGAIIGDFLAGSGRAGRGE